MYQQLNPAVDQQLHKIIEKKTYWGGRDTFPSPKVSVNFCNIYVRRESLKHTFFLQHSEMATALLTTISFMSFSNAMFWHASHKRGMLRMFRHSSHKRGMLRMLRDYVTLLCNISAKFRRIIHLSYAFLVRRQSSLR